MIALLEPEGFLGTGASLLADLTLLAYILLIVPAMLAGYYFARAGYHRPRHKWVMIVITVVNWLLILLLMLTVYRLDVATNIGDQPANPRYLLPAIHALLGLPAQLLATFIVVRMMWEDRQLARARQRGETDLQQYWFKAAKWMMRLTLLLWLATTAMGVFSYVTRYNVVSLPGADVPAPLATDEVDPPAATEEPE